MTDITTEPQFGIGADVQVNKCDACGRSFETKHGLSMHKARAHNGNYGKRKRQRATHSPNELVVNEFLKVVFPDGLPIELAIDPDFHKRIKDFIKEAKSLYKETRPVG